MKRFALLCIFAFVASTAHADAVEVHMIVNGSSVVNACSGGMFIMEGMSLKQKALAITDGHCVNYMHGDRYSYLLPGETLYDVTGEIISENAYVQVSAEAGAAYLVNVEKLLFATMTGTDIAVYQLDKTYEELQKLYGMKPLMLDPKPLKDSDPVVLHSSVFNKAESCTMAGDTSLVEGSYPTNKAVRLSQACEIYPGYSGSPILRADLRTFTGLSNTHYDGSGTPCSLNNPCEVNRATGEKTVGQKGQAYGVPLYMLYNCLDPATHQLNFHLASCDYKPK